MKKEYSQLCIHNKSLEDQQTEMQHELEKEQINLKEHQQIKDEEIKRKMHNNEKNLVDELNR